MTERWFCAGNPCPTTDISDNSSWTFAGSSGLPDYLKSVLSGYAVEGTTTIEPFRPTYDHDGDSDTAELISYLEGVDSGSPLIQNVSNEWQGDPVQQGIAKGDIVWVSKLGVEHVMMVVGWGPLLISWDEIDAFWEAHKNPDGSYNYSVLPETYPQSGEDFGYNPRPEYGFVPYLVDHGLQGVYEQGPGGSADTPVLICPECVRPRPYYALYWERSRVEGIYDTYTISRLDPRDNAPEFIHIPDSLSVPVEEVKAPPSGFSRDEIPTTP